MGQFWFPDAADLLRAAGITVVEPDGDGWKSRARGSGGFEVMPLGVQFHHTASDNEPENDWNWQTTGCDDAPVGNATIMRDGSIWMVAAGAANTAGKGGPVTMSRGVVPIDSGNSRTWAWEVANAGTGQRWPQVQVDVYLEATLVMNRRFGNQPDDVFTHALQPDGTGWTDRKIDPARAEAVDGPWQPRGINSSGTWSCADIRTELRRRAGAPSPIPPPPIGDDMPAVMIKGGDNPTVYAWNGTTLAALPPGWDQAGVVHGVLAEGVTVYAQADIDALLAHQGSR